MGAARSCWLLIRADRAPDVKGSLAAAHYCEGPWPSNHTRRTRQTAPTTAPRPVPGATSATASIASAQDRAGDDAAYRAAVVDLLGALAYGELTAFCRLAADAELAPTLPDKAALAGLAVAEFHHYEPLTASLGELGVDPEEAMEPFIAPIDAFHDRTRPTGWLEGLVKAYVGDGIATDFYREISAYVDPATQDLVRSVLQDVGQAEFAVRAVREAIAADPRSPAGSPCGGAGSSARRSRRRSASRSSGTRSRRCSSAVTTGRAPTWPSWAGCSRGSPTSTPAGWTGSACPPEPRSTPYGGSGRSEPRRRTKAPSRVGDGAFVRPVWSQAVSGPASCR